MRLVGEKAVHCSTFRSLYENNSVALNNLFRETQVLATSCRCRRRRRRRRRGSPPSCFLNLNSYLLFLHRLELRKNVTKQFSAGDFKTIKNTSSWNRTRDRPRRWPPRRPSFRRPLLRPTRKPASRASSTPHPLYSPATPRLSFRFKVRGPCQNKN